MIIKSIELNNFRIYKGVNQIILTPDGERNIIIVSGNNGFGKTTFLMSLVWCLYGKNMEKVDDLYKKEIDEKGGYNKYIGNSLNVQAAQEGETRFSVSVTFTNVEIPNTTCTEITIVRSYDSATSTNDELKILIDGKDNDLFSDKNEEEMFIRDYILPIEIAKFFFFDAALESNFIGKLVEAAHVHGFHFDQVVFGGVFAENIIKDLSDYFDTAVLAVRIDTSANQYEVVVLCE